MLKRQRISVKRLISRYGTPAELILITDKYFDIRTGFNTNVRDHYPIQKALRLTSTIFRQFTTQGVFLDFSKSFVAMTRKELPENFTVDIEHRFLFEKQEYCIKEITKFPDLEIVIFQLEGLKKVTE